MVKSVGNQDRLVVREKNHTTDLVIKENLIKQLINIGHRLDKEVKSVEYMYNWHEGTKTTRSCSL